MPSSNPNTIHPSKDGFVPRASYVLDPRPLQDSSNDDFWLQLHNICYQGRSFTIFMSILLGDDQVLHEGVTSNKRRARSVTNHDTMQAHGRKLANPMTKLWLPTILKNKNTSLVYMTGENFLKLMRIVLEEVLKFGAKATNVVKAFARMEVYLVEHVLFNVEDLRVALQAIVQDIETTAELPSIDLLLPDIELSKKFVRGASYILQLQPLARVNSNNHGDLLLQLRAKLYQLDQFYIFLSILLDREDQSPDEEAIIVYNNGGTLSSGTNHHSLLLQSHGSCGELVATTTFWICEYLKKRDAILDHDGNLCWDHLKGLFKEVMKYGARATDVAKAFTKMEIDHVEYLLEHPEDLQLTLQRFNTIAEDKDTGELIEMFVSDEEFDLPLDVLPNELLPNIELMDDDYIKLRVLHYFGNLKNK